jgi:hypothetical protein
MWYNNKSVTYVYAHVNTKYAFAVIESLSGWKRINPTSADGVSNVLDILSTAKAKGKKVNVYIGSDDQITAASMN